jgi:hypothetical protein
MSEATGHAGGKGGQLLFGLSLTLGAFRAGGAAGIGEVFKLVAAFGAEVEVFVAGHIDPFVVVGLEGLAVISVEELVL